MACMVFACFICVMMISRWLLLVMGLFLLLLFYREFVPGFCLGYLLPSYLYIICFCCFCGIITFDLNIFLHLIKKKKKKSRPQVVSRAERDALPKGASPLVCSPGFVWAPVFMSSIDDFGLLLWALWLLLLVPKILILSTKPLDCASWLRIHHVYALRLSSH